MPIMKRRLDICGREKNWEYTIESGGHQFFVSARQIGRNDPHFSCSCGAGTEDVEEAEDGGDVFAQEYTSPGASACSHIAEVQRDLSIARQAAAQMVL